MKTQLYLWPRQNSQKKHPLAIRLTDKRKSKFVFIGYAIKKEHWNRISKSIRTSYENYEKVSALIKEKMKEIEHLSPSSNDLQNYNKNSFFQYFDKHLHNLETGKKIADKKKHSVVLEHLKVFLKKSRNTEDLLFKDITGDFLNELTYYFDGEKLAKSTQNGYFKKIKHLYYLAINNNVFLPVRNPFETFENKSSKPKNNSLTVSEFKGLELFNPHQYRDKGFFENSQIPVLNTLRNTFVFQFYCYGIRVSDLILLKWDNINNGKIVYKMRKTGVEKTIQLNNSLIERLRFFLPNYKKILLLKQKDYILDVELLNSLPSNEKDALMKYIKERKPALLKKVEEKEIKLFKETYYKETDIQYNTITHICNGLATDLTEKNNYIIPFLSNTEKEKLNSAELEDLTTYKIIQSKTTIYNRDLKQLNTWFLDINGQLIKTKLTSHLPRHTFTSIALNLGLDIFTISQSLGHSDIKTTTNYIHTIDVEAVDNNVVEVFKKFDGLNEAIIQKNKKIAIVNANREPVKRLET